MKKFTTVLTVVMTLCSMMLLTSCQDEMISYDLEGTWKGDMYMIRDGHRAVYTELEFYGDPFRSTSGTGYWLDVYSNRRDDYFCSRIEWKVRDRTIHIWLLDDRDRYGNPFELIISDYHLNNDRFWGYVDYEGGSREFSLYHTSSPHWNDYDYGYYDDDYYYGYDYYFAKGSRANDSIPQKVHTHEMAK